MTLAYIIAQKLHASTDHSIEGWSNDRARDLIDVLLVRRLLEPDDLPEVRRACVEVFRLRGKQPWPPAISIPDAWQELFVVELAKAPGFEPTDVYAAAAAVGDLITIIDAA